MLSYCFKKCSLVIFFIVFLNGVIGIEGGNEGIV